MMHTIRHEADQGIVEVDSASREEDETDRKEWWKKGAD